MDDVKVIFFEQPKLNNTIMIEGLPGIGLVGKLAADHMLDEIKAKKFAEIYSPYLPPQVMIKDDGTVKLVNMELYYHKREGGDIILLIGDFQGITPESQYNLAEKTIEVGKKFNLKRIFTLGGLGTGNITRNPKVFGAATDLKLVKEFEKYGIIFKGGGAIFGASGLLLGLGMQHNIEAVCLMGETHGQIIDAKSAEAVLDVLTKILDIEIDMSALAEKAKETEKQLSKISKMLSTQKQLEDSQQKFLDESPYYIR
ncbi:MAG: proteasome assembly chaperone family protein [Candidatus Altiarchaeota archaeon]